MIVENGCREYAKAIYGENVVMTYLSWNIINVSLFHASSPGIGYQIKQPENPSYKARNYSSRFIQVAKDGRNSSLESKRII
jgi:hypothetical protein